MSEFSVIADYFAQQHLQRDDIALGIGDDAALCQVSQYKQLAISVDMLVEGVHFPLTTSAYDIGWKSLAVNLSDMAAMGARPLWFTLAISMPAENPAWLEQFCKGMFDLAAPYQVQLVGGDTTRGPLCISIQIAGEYSHAPHMQRANARPGDSIYVTGKLGDAALGLLSLTKNLSLSAAEQSQLLSRLNRPEPRVNQALAFNMLVNAAIDISDGLQADLSHILEASNVGADVWVDDLPLSALYRRLNQNANRFDLALTGGDDYELCLTVPLENEKQFLMICNEMNCQVTKIGVIKEGRGLSLLQGNNQPYVMQKKSYDHFG